MASMVVLVPGAAGMPPAGEGDPSAGISPEGRVQPGGSPERADAARQPPSCYLRHIDASVSVDERNGSMSVRARLSLEAGRDGSYFIFRLRPAMTVRSVADEAGGGLQFTRPFWYFYNVSLGRSVNAGEAVNLTVRYDGPVQNTPDSGTSYWDYAGWQGAWVRTYGDYFPSDEGRSRSTGRLAVTAPRGRTVVSSGDLVARTEDPANGTAETVWAWDSPQNGISFVAGDLNRTGYDSGGRHYDLYLRSEHSGWASAYAAEMARAVSFYEAQFGPAGFRNLSVAEVPYSYAAWGQSTPGMMWLSSRNFDGPLPYRLISHEAAHQWWGIDVEGNGSGENFLQEGFSGYSEVLYEMRYYGSRGYLDYCRQQYISRFVQSTAPEPVLVSNDYDLASYKGPWVLHMLRYQLGDVAFNRTLRDFHTGHAGGRADHFDLQDQVFLSAGRDLSAFFHWWLYSSGRLDYAIADAVVLRGPAGTDRVQVDVESRGVLGDLPADLGFYFEGSASGRVPAAWNGSGACATLEYDIGYPVDTVRLDPDGWLLDAYPSSNEAPTRDGFNDMLALGLTVAPGAPVENAPFTASAVIAFNSSEGPRDVDASLLVDGAAVRNITVAVVPGALSWANFTLALPAGNHSLAAVADPRHIVYESDEGNNRASLNVTVEPLPPVRPDIGIVPGGISVLPAGVAGGRAAFISVGLANIGPAAAPVVAVDLWVDSLETGYAGRTGELSLGPSETAEALLPWTAVSGWHQITARAVLGAGQADADLSNNEATTQVYVNSAPTAVLSASPLRPAAGDIVDFTGTLSVDDTRVARWLFDFGDGEDTGWLSDGTTFHAYAAKGTYQARLLVQDDTGAESDWSAPAVVRVASLPPQAAIRAVRRTADVLTPLAFSSLSSDPDGSITALAWSFGDGSSASGGRVNHTWARKGFFTVTLTATDDDGLSSSATLVVSIVDLPPVPAISFDGRTARPGQRVLFSAQNTTDPDDPPSAITYLWDFGAGRRASGPEASCAFIGEGRHRVTLTASDGNLSASTWVEIEIRAAAPPAASAAAGPLAWVVLGLLLATMLVVAAWAVIPVKHKAEEEEE